MKKMIYRAAVLLSVFMTGTLVFAQLSRSAPEAQGISSKAILTFIDRAESEIDALHSLMIVRHGHVVASGWWEPYGELLPHQLFSLSKSFTSTAIGMAADEGLLSLNDTVLSFFPEDKPANPIEKLKSMRVRDLLSMSSGHQDDTAGRLQQEGKTWVQSFLTLDVEHKPGTHFKYNSGATYMLSAILQKVTGQTVNEFLQPRLYEPLGIENAVWNSCPDGVNFGGWGLNVITSDIAKLGQLYLQKGQWKGQQLLSEAYVQKATCRQSSNGSNPDNDWEQGYGYQFWMCRHHAYRGDGAFGQFCIVMPEQDAVVAITSGVGDMGAVLNLVWDVLLPAMEGFELPENKAVHKRLEQKLAALTLAFPGGRQTSPMASTVSGKTFVFDKNENGIESMTLEFRADKTIFTVRNRQGVHAFDCGFEAWIKGVTYLNAQEPRNIAACGAWTDESCFLMKTCFYETPFSNQAEFKFVNDALHFKMVQNVGFGKPEPVVLIGKVR